MSDTNDTTPMDKIAVANYLNCSVPQILNLVARGDIPEGQYIGGKKKYWFKAHLDEYKARMMAKAAATWVRSAPAVAEVAVATPPKPLRVVPDRAPSTSSRSKRQLEAAIDRDIRQAKHIQESCQAEIEPHETRHLKDILGELKVLLKSRKAGA